MNAETIKTCSRPGCEKKLRSDNSSGKCASNCLSSEAPPAHRAKGAGSRVTIVDDATPPRAKAPKRTENGASLTRFRLVADALGKDADAILEEFAQAWLEALAQKLED